MKRAAIISEYDPFHNGHKYQTDRLREMGAECIVSVLGGTCSQRGGCHITDKYFRAEAAVVSGGCDLVLELPYPYSCSGAKYFAEAGVRIAAAFCDSIAFGCEADDPEMLWDIARFLCSDGFNERLSKMRKTFPEVSAPRLTELLICETLGEAYAREAALPNNILSVEYLRAIIQNGLSLEPIFIKRFGADHNSAEASGNICSATLVRDMILSDNEWRNFCPSGTVDTLMKARSCGSLGASLALAERAVLYALRSIAADDADLFAECGGGLGRRIVNAASEASDLDTLYSLLSTKRYTNARIRRAVISMLTGATEEDEAAPPLFTCLLAANAAGLSAVKRPSLTVLSSPSDIRRCDLGRSAELYLSAERFDSLCYPVCLPEYEFFRRVPTIFSDRA